MLGGLATLGNQLIHQRPSWFYELPYMALRLLDAMLQRRDPYFTAFQTRQHVVAGVDVQSLAKGHRKDNSAVFINA
jgi:hypothetical protein